ncbi:hypothetical protein ACTXT7_012218 [Hymenolepis weldensis]
MFRRELAYAPSLESENEPESDNESNQSEELSGKETDPNSATSSINNTSTKSSTEVTAFSFHCERVILTTTSLPSKNKTEIVATSTDPPNSLMVNLVDFPRGGTSIIEVSSGNGESQVTTSISERLAFCRNGEREFQLFYTVPPSSDSDDGSSDVEEGSRSICQIILTSEGDAEKLYRSVLMRVGRHFLIASGLLKEREGEFNFHISSVKVGMSCHQVFVGMSLLHYCNARKFSFCLYDLNAH